MNTFRSPAPAASLFSGNTGKNSGILSNAANTLVTATNTALNNATNAVNTAVNTANTTGVSLLKKGPTPTQFVFIGSFVILILFVAIYWRQIGNGFSSLYEKIRQFFGATPEPIPATIYPGVEEVTQKPEAPQDDKIKEHKLVEKILPGRKQVFNINKNTYTYYDAEPLCKALGAELATYEQVKEAYGGGGEWCNYGWTKGQMAVFPTQQDTYDELQMGPPGQRGACGRPGVNGGFFDNPELRFGVNCYGVKPEQKEHDATIITSGDGAPLTPEGLEFEQKVQKYRGEADHIGILPFNKSTWSA